MSGISGVFSNNRKVIEDEHVARLLYEDGIIQDKRGQAGAGIVLANPKRIKKPLKGSGPARVSTPFERIREMSDHTTFAGIMSNLYSKDSDLKYGDIHPIPISSRKYEIFIASDGVVLDKEAKRRELEDEGYVLKSNTSSAVIGTSFAKYLDRTGDLFEAGERVIEENHGSGVFSSIMLVRRKKDSKTKLVLLRDKTANKPMYIGETDNTLFVNSETFPLERNGINSIERVKGGDVIVFSDNGIDSKNFGNVVIEKPCVFEIIYFGNNDNRVMGTLGPGFKKYLERLERNADTGIGPSNFTIRNCLGLSFYDYWKEKVPEPELISPVVTSGTGFTHGVACGYDINPRKYIPTIGINDAIKTFQLSDKDKRKVETNVKMRYITDILESIKLWIGDDSIVRGGVGGINNPEEVNDSYFSERYKGLISQLKNIGKVSEILMAISYAPMFFQCFYSFGNMEDNAAQDYVGMPFEDVCDAISRKIDPEWGEDGRFRVLYNHIENIYNVCGKGFCTACADGNYPIREEFIPQEILQRKEKYKF